MTKLIEIGALSLTGASAETQLKDAFSGVTFPAKFTLTNRLPFAISYGVGKGSVRLNVEGSAEDICETFIEDFSTLVRIAKTAQSFGGIYRRPVAIVIESEGDAAEPAAEESTAVETIAEEPETEEAEETETVEETTPVATGKRRGRKSKKK